MSDRPAISALTLLTQWNVNWVALTAGGMAVVWYSVMTRRVRAAGQYWSVRRGVLFYVGAAGYLWCTNGFPNAYAATLMWTWSSQVLALLLLVPVFVMAGQPVELASRTAKRRSTLESVAISRLARLLTHPFVSTALVPILTAALFFGHVADFWTSNPGLAGLVGLGLVAVGCLVARQLTFDDLSLSSLAIGIMLAVSVLELLTDAIPGIVLRFSTHLVTTHFAVRHEPWAMSPLADQQLSGSVLWGVAELLDLPFMFIVFVRWIRADEREGRRADQLSSTARSAPGDAIEAAPADTPWWLTDPQLAQRPGFVSDTRTER